MADRRDKRILAPIGLGVQFAAAMGLGVLLGLWVDRRFGTEPWALIAGAAVGLGAGFYHFLKSAQRSWRQMGGGAPPGRKKTIDGKGDAD